MAIFTKQPQLKNPEGIQKTIGRTLDFGDPFCVEIRQTDPDKKSTKVAVSKYSSILKSPNITNTLDIIGLDFEFDLKYGDKVWLEIYYDPNLEPVFSIINSGNKWKNTFSNPQKRSQPIPIYPEELEFITKYDLKTRLNELQKLSDTISSMSDTSSDYYEKLFSLGYNSREVTDQLKKDSIIKYNDTKTLIKNYRNSLNSFFTGADNYKKLYKSYTLIAYTTKDFNASLKGNKVFLPNVLTGVAAGVQQAQEDNSFKIVPSLLNNLILADICYQNRYAAKLPIPYHGAIFPFANRFGQFEETLNTK